MILIAVAFGAGFSLGVAVGFLFAAMICVGAEADRATMQFQPPGCAGMGRTTRRQLSGKRER